MFPFLDQFETLARAQGCFNLVQTGSPVSGKWMDKASGLPSSHTSIGQCCTQIVQALRALGPAPVGRAVLLLLMCWGALFTGFHLPQELGSRPAPQSCLPPETTLK